MTPTTVKIVYFDCPTGIAGNMCLAALLDAGLPLPALQAGLAKLGLSAEYELQVSQVQRQGQRATHLQVKLKDPGYAETAQSDKAHASHAHHRHLFDIQAMIQQAQLPEPVERWSLDIFQTLAIAEGAVHGIPPEAVHFHEVGAVDAIVDIVGTCLGLDYLGIEQVFCSALPTGGGTVQAAHGLLPVPAPAVMQLLASRQVPIYDNQIHKELVTPTGAAIAVTLAQQFGPPPAFTLQKVGLGAGTLELPLPNMVRMWVGEMSPTQGVSPTLESIWVLETQVDDLSPQVVGFLFDTLLAAGAVDVFCQSIGMKKSRPGLLLTVLCHDTAIARCEQILFRETTTLGIRRSRTQRRILPRQTTTVTTELGPIQLKIAAYEGQTVNVQPEYEDCAAIARQHQVPLKTVQQMALTAWQKTLDHPHPRSEGS